MQFEVMPYQHCRHSCCIPINFNRRCCDVVASAFLKRFPIVIHYNVQSIKPTHDLQYHAWNFLLLPIKFHLIAIHSIPFGNFNMIIIVQIPIDDISSC